MEFPTKPQPLTKYTLSWFSNANYLLTSPLDHITQIFDISPLILFQPELTICNADSVRLWTTNNHYVWFYCSSVVTLRECLFRLPIAVVCAFMLIHFLAIGEIQTWRIFIPNHFGKWRSSQFVIFGLHMEHIQILRSIQIICHVIRDRELRKNSAKDFVVL